MKPCNHRTFVENCQICRDYRDKPAMKMLWDRIGRNRNMAEKIKPHPCRSCSKKAQSTKRDIICCEVLGHGVGDLVMGTTALAGLAVKHPQAKLIYRVQQDQAEWARLFTGYDVSVDRIDPEPEYDFRFTPVDTYNRELRERWQKTRAEYYCELGDCGTPARPTPAPLTELAWAEDYRGCVVICPTSAWSSREILPSWVKCLILELKKVGHRPVLICRDEHKVREYNCEKLINQSAAKIASLMSVAHCFVGLDSGMTHVAGALGVRSICLCGPTQGDRIYDVYGTVACVSGPLPCSGCAWRGEAFSKQCSTICASLNGISIERVMGLVGPK